MIRIRVVILRTTMEKKNPCRTEHSFAWNTLIFDQATSTDVREHTEIADSLANAGTRDHWIHVADSAERIGEFDCPGSVELWDQTVRRFLRPQT